MGKKSIYGNLTGVWRIPKDVTKITKEYREKNMPSRTTRVIIPVGLRVLRRGHSVIARIEEEQTRKARSMFEAKRSTETSAVTWARSRSAFIALSRVVGQRQW